MARKVLIVEDNDLNRKLFRDLLRTHGYETLEATDGMKAMEMAAFHHPDLMILDIQLPKTSGIDVIKWMKGDLTLNHIPIVAVTAFAMRSDELKIKHSGCDAYLPKPISIDKFLKTVDKFALPQA